MKRSVSLIAVLLMVAIPALGQGDCDTDDGNVVCDPVELSVVNPGPVWAATGSALLADNNSGFVVTTFSDAQQFNVDHAELRVGTSQFILSADRIKMEYDPEREGYFEWIMVGLSDTALGALREENDEVAYLRLGGDHTINIRNLRPQMEIVYQQKTDAEFHARLR